MSKIVHEKETKGFLIFATIEHCCPKCGKKWSNGFYYDICQCGEYVL